MINSLLTGAARTEAGIRHETCEVLHSVRPTHTHYNVDVACAHTRWCTPGHALMHSCTRFCTHCTHACIHRLHADTTFAQNCLHEWAHAHTMRCRRMQAGSAWCAVDGRDCADGAHRQLPPKLLPELPAQTHARTHACMLAHARTYMHMHPLNLL